MNRSFDAKFLSICESITQSIQPLCLISYFPLTQLFYDKINNALTGNLILNTNMVFSMNTEYSTKYSVESGIISGIITYLNVPMSIITLTYIFHPKNYKKSSITRKN